MGDGSIAIVQLGKLRLDKVSKLPKSPKAHITWLTIDSPDISFCYCRHFQACTEFEKLA